jgi:hypothetical protein
MFAAFCCGVTWTLDQNFLAAIFAAESATATLAAKMVSSQADLLPWHGAYEVIRSSNLQLSEIANARRCGTAASVASRTAGDTASRTAGEASSVRSFVVRIVERVVVALGRDTDAATIFTCVP